jgi:hypothetical protein
MPADCEPATVDANGRSPGAAAACVTLFWPAYRPAKTYVTTTMKSIMIVIQTIMRVIIIIKLK